MTQEGLGISSTLAGAGIGSSVAAFFCVYLFSGGGLEMTDPEDVGRQEGYRTLADKMYAERDAPRTRTPQTPRAFSVHKVRLRVAHRMAPS